MSYRNSNSMPEIDIEEAIMAAISELGGSEGASLDGIEWYLTTALKEVPDRGKILLSINDAVDKKLLSKLPNGNYKVVDSAKREQKSGKVECDCAKVFRPKDEKIELISRSKKVGPQEGKSTVDNVSRSKPANGEDKMKDTSRYEKDAQGAKNAVDKVFTSKTADEEAKMKDTSRREKDSQDPTNTIEKVFTSKTANGETKMKNTSRSEKDTKDPKGAVDKGFESKLVNGEVKTKDTARRDDDAQEANLNAADPSNRNIKRSTSDDDNMDDLYMS